MRTVDVVIAGAGVAGCLAARDLADKGHSVLLLEKGSRESLGHDWWDTIEEDVFEAVGLPPSEPPERLNPFVFDIHTPEGPAGLTAAMPADKINVDRKLLAQRILGYAEDAGAEIRFNTPARSPIIIDGAVAGLRTATGGDEEEIRAKITIDASGAAGALRSGMPGGLGFEPRLSRENFVSCYREIREDTTGGAGKSILLIGDGPGAQWISRNERGLVDFFACVIDEPGNKSPRDLVAALVAKDGGAGEIKRGGHAARIPVRQALDSCVAPGFMIVGDSACMANPLNGSGISTSLIAASMAARTADIALRKGQWDTAALWSYNTAYKRERDWKFAKLYLLQKLMGSEPIEHFHIMLIRNIMTPNSSWDMENEMNLKTGIRRLPQILSLVDHPAFFARIAFAFHLTTLMEQHYKNYPRSYDPRRFRRWVRRKNRIIRMVPRGNG